MAHRSDGNEMSLAVAQIKARPENFRGSLATHVRMAEEAARRGARFLLFPELSLTGYSRALSAADTVDATTSDLAPLAEISCCQQMVISVGLPLAATGGLLIASLSFLPDGRRSVYTKRYLHAGEEKTFAVGTGGPLLSAGERRIGMAICAEINHRAHIEQTLESGAHVYAASCFLTPNGYDADCLRLEQYARQYGVVVLMANFAGPSGGIASAGRSAIWDEGGQLLARAPATEEYLVLATRARDTWSGSVHPVSI